MVSTITPTELGHVAAHPPHMQVGERLVQRIGDGAAKAPGFEQHDVVAPARNQQVVEPDLAELVDDHRGQCELRRLEHAVEQRRLAAPEESGQQKHRDARRGRAMDQGNDCQKGNEFDK